MPSGPRRLSRRARLVALATSLGIGPAGLPTVAVAATQPAEVPDAPAAGGSDETEASTTRAAILPLVVEGDEMPEADEQQLTGRLVEGLQRGAFEVIPPEEVLAAAPEAAKCQDAGCYATIAKATGATHVVPDFSDTQRVFELLTA